MTINLRDFERGKKYDGDYSADLQKLQARLARIQVAHIVHRRRSIVLIEGWDASGKGGVIRRIVAQWDPRYFEVWPISAPTQEEKDRHFLWRFWQKLPASQDINVFDRSWYGRVLVERVEGFCAEQEWKRAYDEINEFEAQQIDSGTNLVKLFMHVTQKEQDERLADRLSTPWKRWKTGPEDYRNRARRDDYLAAMDDMFRLTNTRWAPWQVIDGNNKKTARIAALTYVAERLEAAVSMEMPDADLEVVKLAKDAFGYNG